MFKTLLQMLKGLLHMMNAWRHSIDGLYYLDEHNKRLSGTKRSGKGGPAACIMKRILALTRRRVQLSQHAPVLKAFQELIRLLQQRYPDCFPAGIYSYELQALVHQVQLLSVVSIDSGCKPFVTSGWLKLMDPSSKAAAMLDKTRRSVSFTMLGYFISLLETVWCQLQSDQWEHPGH